MIAGNDAECMGSRRWPSVDVVAVGPLCLRCRACGYVQAQFPVVYRGDRPFGRVEPHLPVWLTHR